ncbi:Hypothetical predicted protein, partial [Pelobates cultripes]
AFIDEKDEDYKRDRIAAWHGTSYLHLKGIYVKSQDSVYIHPVKSAALCHENISVRVDYDLGEKKVKEVNKVNEVKVFYVVLAKNKILYSGQKTVNLEKADSRSGSMEISLPVRDVSPTGKILVFTLSDDGEVAVDTATFQVTACLKQNVTLGFSEERVHPSSLVKLNLRAAPGSLCALRVVDKSVTLMKPEDELTEAKIQNLIKTQPYYPPYESLDYEFCRDNGPTTYWGIISEELISWWHPRYVYPVKKKDIQNIIEDMGLTIVTNWNVMAPVTCKFEREMMTMTGIMVSASLHSGPVA